MSLSWSPELDDILTLMFDVMTASELGELLGRTHGSVYARSKHLGLQKSHTFISEISRLRTLQRSPFTPAVRATIARLYPTTLTQDLAATLGLETSAVHAYANRSGLKKTAEFVRQTAQARCTPDHPMRSTQFQPGIVPWNKGTKGIQFEGMQASQFKKGNRPHTWKPVGTYRIDADGYLQRKVSDTGYPPRDWKFVHRLVWIEQMGPIPKGHIVRFKNGRRISRLEEITVDVLECISMAENLQRNHPRSVSPELGRLVQLRAVMSRQINKYSKLNQSNQELTP